MPAPQRGIKRVLPGMPKRSPRFRELYKKWALRGQQRPPSSSPCVGCCTS
jgi:hypothetical protein